MVINIISLQSPNTWTFDPVFAVLSESISDKKNRVKY